jgi:reductive dehalogenase|tara:strand:- start:6334 stop:7533 length:1200 start_codon:yes stop_codon:yes gene_type:complete
VTILTTYKRAYDGTKLDPYPVESLKRVDRPTTFIDEERIQRVDQRAGGFARARSGGLGPSYQNLLGLFKYPLSRAQQRMAATLADKVDGPVAEHRAPGTDDPEAMARHIKATAYFLRADVVGICRLPPYAVYSHSQATGEPIECAHKYAIAVLVDQDWKTADASFGNDWISTSMGFLSYSTTAFISCILADYIRKLGYPARAHHIRNYQVMLPPILLWAGLGEMCRTGDIVLNPFLGTRFKAAVVTTDLPLAIDRPIDFGLQDFCSKCAKCATHCPAGAIPFGEDSTVVHNGYVKWNNDVDRCLKYRIGNQWGSGCGVCIHVCPWNKPFTPFHRFVRWTMTNIPLARRLAIWGDDLMGYGTPNQKNKWWHDLEAVDGVLQTPDRSGKRFVNSPTDRASD